MGSENGSRRKYKRRKRSRRKRQLPAVPGAGQTHPGLPYFTMDKGIETLLDQPPDALAKLPPNSRTRLAVKLRIAGASYEQIAEKLGYKHSDSAMRATRRAVEQLYELTQEELEQVLKLDLARLDVMQLVYWEKATRYGDEKAGKLILDIMQKRQELLGISSSGKGYNVNVNMTGANPQMLVIGGTEEEVVEQLREITGGPTLQEVYDAEIVEEEHSDDDG
jgi:hypothetical protein